MSEPTDGPTLTEGQSYIDLRRDRVLYIETVSDEVTLAKVAMSTDALEEGLDTGRYVESSAWVEQLNEFFEVLVKAITPGIAEMRAVFDLEVDDE